MDSVRGCGGDIECLSDGSHTTFVAAGTENTDGVNLYTFDEFSVEGTVIDPNSLVIERVVAEIYAKLGNTGYLSFAVDDPTEGEHYFTPSISIGSNSFQSIIRYGIQIQLREKHGLMIL